MQARGYLLQPAILNVGETPFDLDLVVVLDGHMIEVATPVARNWCKTGGREHAQWSRRPPRARRPRVVQECSKSRVSRLIKTLSEGGGGINPLSVLSPA